jgi:MSHA pilin protein MshD
MCTESHLLRQRSQGGISLVELIMFIVIVSLGIVGILSVMNVTTKASADPMLRKQALAIAESLLEEIQLQPYTFCDPDDANATTATAAVVGANGCDSTVQGIGATPGETRYAEPRFDNVGDYHGFSMTGINDILNNPITGLGNYAVNVNITQSAADVLQIDVTASVGSTSVGLTGYRYRYAPRAVP